MSRSNMPLVLGLALALLFGCGGTADTKAQEKAPDAKDDKGGGEKPAAKPDEKGGAKTEVKKEDPNKYKATLLDKSNAPDNKEYSIEDAVIWVPDVSLFGGEGHADEKRLTVKKGAAELEVLFTEISSVEVGEPLKEHPDRLVVRVYFVPDKEGKRSVLGEKDDCSVKTALLVHGKYNLEGKLLDAKIRLRDLKTLKLETMPAEKK